MSRPCQSLRTSFQSHIGPISTRAGARGAPSGEPRAFQSHIGPISTHGSKSNSRLRLIVSIPYWSDFNSGSHDAEIETLASFNPILVRFQLDVYFIGVSNTPEPRFNPILVRFQRVASFPKERLSGLQFQSHIGPISTWIRSKDHNVGNS